MRSVLTLSPPPLVDLCCGCCLSRSSLVQAHLFPVALSATSFRRISPRDPEHAIVLVDILHTDYLALRHLCQEPFIDFSVAPSLFIVLFIAALFFSVISVPASSSALSLEPASSTSPSPELSIVFLTLMSSSTVTRPVTMTGADHLSNRARKRERIGRVRREGTRWSEELTLATQGGTWNHTVFFVMSLLFPPRIPLGLCLLMMPASASQTSARLPETLLFLPSSLAAFGVAYLGQVRIIGPHASCSRLLRVPRTQQRRMLCESQLCASPMHLRGVDGSRRKCTTSLANSSTNSKQPVSLNYLSLSTSPQRLRGDPGNRHAVSRVAVLSLLDEGDRVTQRKVIKSQDGDEHLWCRVTALSSLASSLIPLNSLLVSSSIRARLPIADVLQHPHSIVAIVRGGRGVVRMTTTLKCSCEVRPSPCRDIACASLCLLVSVRDSSSSALCRCACVSLPRPPLTRGGELPFPGHNPWST